MSGLLTDVMHERAERAGTPDLDLDAILAAGDRRLRGRRLATGLAAAGVAGVVAVGGVALPGLLDRETAPAPTTSPFAARHVSWAVGSTIHWGERTFDVGRRVRSYVQTDDGFVWTSPDESVHFFDGSTSQEIGRADGGYLAAGDTGSYVAWTAPRTTDRGPRYVVYDTAERAVTNEVAADVDDDAGEVGRVMAVDADTTYWRQGDRLVRFTVPNGDETTLVVTPATAAPPTQEMRVGEVVDAAHGVVAYTVESDQSFGMAVGRRIDASSPTLTSASHGFLSPDGRYLTSEQDDFIAVHDTATGEDVTPDLTRYPYAVGYAWVDDDTVAAYGLTDLQGDGPYTADILTCDIGGTCTTVGSLDIDVATFALPIGQPLDS